MHFPAVEKIVLVQDNLSTHTPASLYTAFPAPEARRLVNRFEWHYTPKHGSWLDMADSELAVLTTQCLSRRIPNKQTLEKEVAAWQSHRNKHHAKADWQFTTENARVKLKRLFIVSKVRIISSGGVEFIGPSMDDGVSVELVHCGDDALLEFLFRCDADVARDGAGKLGTQSSRLLLQWFLSRTSPRTYRVTDFQ